MEDAELRRRLAALLPRSVWPLVAGRAEGRRTEGCILFADLAGFTALTETLAGMGREGAEELTRILNAFFAAQIAVVHRAGGDVLRFGGDALTVFFEGGAGPGLKAALAMQEAAASFRDVATRGGSFSLAMKIGAAEGPVLLGLLGDDAVGRDYFGAGRALDEAAEAEHHAARGEILLSPGLMAEAARLGFALEEREEGFGRLLGGQPSEEPDAGRGACEPPPLSALEAFLPPWAVEKARLEEGLWAAEHRRTTVLFLSFAGLDYDGDARILEKAGAVYGEVAASVRRFGGWVNKVDMGDKGSKVIALFGAPMALEETEEAACRAALQILENPPLRRLLSVVRIGIATAPLFAAYVGCEERREFTVMGDGINLSARLMANAHAWRVLCDRTTKEKAATLAFRALDPIFVKGKKEKVPIFRPEGEREEASEERRAFVGRKDLLETVTALLKKAPGPPAVALSGPPGAGKSALLHRLGLSLEEAGVRHATVPLAPHSAHGYLSAFRPVLFSALGVSRSAPPAIKEAALRAALQPEDFPYLPLFGPVLAFPAAETAETRALSPKDRKDLLFAMAQRILKGLSAAGPYVLALDGLEHADPASLDLLEFLLQGAEGSLRFLLSFRDGTVPRVEALTSPESRFRVEPFSEEEVQEFLVKAAGAAPPPEAFVAFLHRKTGGNPKFLEQILRAMEEQGLFKPGPSGLLEVDEDRLASARFPDTLEGMLLSRADVLPEAERRLLKTAAVLGTSFSLNLLSRLAGEAAEGVAEKVRSLEERSFVRMDSWGARPYAVFTDSLVRDALYESLNFETRRGLHREAARLLESESAADRRTWPALARHFEAAAETAPALKYLGLCVDEARARYDNTAAFDFLTRLVALKEAAGASPDKDPDYRRALLHLAESAKELGRLEEAEALSRKILDGVAEPCEETVVSLMRLADLERRKGNLERSLELDEEAMARSTPLGDPVLESRILLDSGVGHAMAGRFDEALPRFQKAERLARKAGTPNWQVLALMNQGLCMQYASQELGRAQSLLKKSLRFAKRYGLRPQSVTAGVNLAQVLAEMGRYREALNITEEVLRMAKQFGYRNLSIGLSGNRALYLTLLGRWEEAAQENQATRRQAQSFRLTVSLAFSIHTAGLQEAVRGSWGEAIRLQQEAAALFEACRRGDGVKAALAEALWVRNALRLPAVSRGPGETNEDGAAGSPSAGAHNLAILVQETIQKARAGGLTLAEAWTRLETIARDAGKAQILWLLTEAAEGLVRLLVEAGKFEEAALAGLAWYPAVVRQDSPLKCGPFLLSLGQALLATGRKEALSCLLRRLARWGCSFDRGLLGLRYRLLRAEAAESVGRLRSARYHARLARRIADAVEALQTDPVFREAYRALPEVARLKALESRLSCPSPRRNDR